VLADIANQIMKITIFYSWQSDLPNRTNRGYIQKSIEKATERILEKNDFITEITIESDSRNESGTPDLVNTIFSKIDSSDIFICDISIINSSTTNRKVPNPNVLIELGYASSRIGWEKIISIYNTDFGRIEDLPFDIRHRKPITYTSELKNLDKVIESQIVQIIENYISDKKYYIGLKREIDLALQAVLIDLSTILYFQNTQNRYNYDRILYFDLEDLKTELLDLEVLGFLIFKDNTENLKEFMEFFNNQVYINFLSKLEKNTLSKIILQLRNLFKVLADESIYHQNKKNENYYIVEGQKVNPNNPTNSYLLMERKSENEGIVLNGGIIIKSKLDLATYYYSIKPEKVEILASIVNQMSFEIQNWIRLTGNYFIFNLNK
jgi:hypothetical protein